MPFVPVPKDLTKVKTKVALNLTKRQLICFGCAAAVGVPTYLLTHTAIGNDIAVLLMIGLMMPFFFFAMYEKDGQPFEKIARNYIRAKLWPAKRPYKTENLYSYLREEGSDFAAKSKTAGTAPASKRQAGKKR
jgi:hypothetical protein